MDIAYDQIQEDSFPKDQEATPPETKPEPQSTLNADIQEAYRAFSTSPWGARLGGFLGSVAKQGGAVYREAQQELTAVGQDASKGLSDIRASIISRTRSLSLTTNSAQVQGSGSGNTTSADTGETPTAAKSATTDDTVLARLRAEASKRLKDIQKAEDAADEALLKFGSNIRDFLRDAIRIAPPSNEAEGQTSTVLFESKDAHGKRVIHTSRFDAQMHVIHTTPESFTKDPSGEEYASWAEKFKVDEKTDDISSDLAKYPELRTTMEKLVPQQIPYADFWQRYYFLRHSIETAEARRRDLLKAASTEEEVGWDEDSDDEAGPSKTQHPERPASTASSTTLHPSSGGDQQRNALESRKSNDEKSQADSDASYDVVGATSGNPSQAPSSPKESRKGDESDEEDWE